MAIVCIDIYTTLDQRYCYYANVQLTSICKIFFAE